MSDDTQHANAVDEALAKLAGSQPWEVAVICGEVRRLREKVRDVEAERDELRFRLDDLRK